MLLRTFNVLKTSVIFARSPIVLFLICVIAFNVVTSSISLTGYRFESEDAVFDSESAVYKIPSNRKTQLRLFGENISDAHNILFTKRQFSLNETCDTMDHTASYELKEATKTMASAEVLFETSTTADLTYFMCLKDANGRYHHMGEMSRVVIVYKAEHIMPLPLQVILVCTCLFLSSIFSGLNLGLMSLDVGELKLIIKCGAAEDKQYAKAILPIRRRGNTLLCTLLFGNTIVNASCTLLLDDLIGQGIFALIGSTIGILIFGEIVPQSICSRYGLRVGYYCRFIVLFFMFGLFPVTFAIGKLLDLILGREIHQVYSRDELREMVKMSFAMGDGGSSSSIDGIAGRSGLKREEVNIVTGALEITEATVNRIMKAKDEIFMLDISVAIDYDLIELINRHGFTRIPIYANGDKNNIVGLLSTKDLLGIDPEDKLPLNSLVEYYPRSILRVLEDTTILDMLNLFKTAKVHLAIVDRIICDEEHDPVKEMVGIVTLEDVIEFILREEIDDEADDLKERRQKEELTDLKTSHMHQMPFKRADTIPQQLNTAAVQFLIANVEAFRKEIVERKVLANLLRFPGIFVIRKHSGKTGHIDNALYSAEKEADYFILVLQGSCQVFIGRERLPFEAGPFHYFGLEALIGPGNVSFNHHGRRTWHSVSISPRSDLSPSSIDDDAAAQHHMILDIAEHNSGERHRHDSVTLKTLGTRITKTAGRAKRLISMISHPSREHDDYDHRHGSSQMHSMTHPSHPKQSIASGMNEDDQTLGLHKYMGKGSHPGSLATLHKGGSLSRHGSLTSLCSVHPAYQYTRKSFVPDFTVEPTQDVQFVRLTNAHYRALLIVTQLARRKDKLDDTAFIVDKLWSELVREGEQFSNFELVAPKVAPLLVSAVDAGVGPSGPNSTRTTPPTASSSMMPLRVSIPNLHHEAHGRHLKTDGSHPEFHVGSSQVTPVSFIGHETPAATPGKFRHSSPLHSVLMASSRSVSETTQGKHRSTASGEAEPLLAVSSAGLLSTPGNADDSAVVFASPSDSSSERHDDSNDKRGPEV